MASLGQEKEENPGPDPGPNLRHPAPQLSSLLVPLQALRDVRTLGCRKAMKKFDSHTLLVSGASVSLSETMARRMPVESEVRGPKLRGQEPGTLA